MDILNVDEVIYHISSISSYKQLILFSRINNKYNKMCNSFINKYNACRMLREFGIKIFKNKYYKNEKGYILEFLLPNFTMDKYARLESTSGIYQSMKYIQILKFNFLVFDDGSCRSSCINLRKFFKAYKILSIKML